MRTLVDIPDDDLQRLDAIAAKDKKSRAATIREAIRLYLVGNADTDWIDRGAGFWAGRTDITDGLEYQLAIREDREPFD